MKTAPEPIAIVRAEGVWLYADDGCRYLDAISSWWVNAHGHSNPYIADRVSAQLRILEHTIFAGFTHPPAIELCERLVELLPEGQRRVFFSDNGSTAVEVGLKMAFQYWWNQGKPRNKVAALEHAYHGDTVGAMSAGGRSTFSEPFEPFLFQVEHLPTPGVTNRAGVVSKFRELMATGDLAAFIYEPVVQGAGGMIMYDEDTMNELLLMAKEAGVLCIADEVMVGFWRTGKMFASTHYDTPPDIMALSKALTGGTMALSVTTCTDAVYHAFLSDDRAHTFFHGHSYTANPTACSAALASLDLFGAADFPARIDRIAQRHAVFAKELCTRSDVRNVRQAGTILAFEYHTPEADSYFNDVRDTLYRHFLDRGVLLRPLGNTIYILPPFVISDDELDLIYSAIRETLGAMGS